MNHFRRNKLRSRLSGRIFSNSSGKYNNTIATLDETMSVASNIKKNGIPPKKALLTEEEKIKL